MTWSSVAYMDETHNDDDYWFCAVVVQVDQIRPTQAALESVASRAAAKLGLTSLPELHGIDLFGQSGHFADAEPGDRVCIYAEALHALTAAQPAIVLKGVRRKKIYYVKPHQLAWRYAIEAVDEFGGDGPILVVADDHDLAPSLREDIRRYIERGTGGWKPREIENVLPDLKFRDSRSNRLLQSADLVAYLQQRRSNIATEKNAKSHEARERLWAKVQPFVRYSGVWDPPERDW